MTLTKIHTTKRSSRNIEPLSRTTDRPIGLVLDAETIVGEWDGIRWRDVPRKAALYVNAVRDIWPKIETGELTSRYWISDVKQHWNPSGWDWESPQGNRHRLYFLKHALDDFSLWDRWEGLLALVECVRAAGANVGSIGGMMGSLERATIPTMMRIPKDVGAPADELWRGSRVEPRRGIRADFKNAVLWDMPNAYPTRLAATLLPRRWVYWEAKPHESIPDEPGFAKALVIVPRMLLGPLPKMIRGFRARFPTHDEFKGTWTLDELRAARDSGATVILYEFWTGSAYSQPWRAWGETVLGMRDSFDGAALRLVKMGANAYVGSLAASGEIGYGRFVNGVEERWLLGQHARPTSVTAHALVTGRTRADLFSSALHPFAYAFITCHTDGAIFMDEPEIDIPGFRIKRRMAECFIINAQTYAWRNPDSDWGYVHAGIPDPAAGRSFWRRWERLKSGVADADKRE